MSNIAQYGMGQTILTREMLKEVLSFVAENERVNISQRTKEGLNIAKLKGKKLGRPASNLPNNYIYILDSYINKSISAKDAIISLNVSRGTFYKILKNYKLKTTI